MYRDTVCTGLLYVQGYCMYRVTVCTGYCMYRVTVCTGILYVQGYCMYRDTVCTGVLYVQGYYMYRDIVCAVKTWSVHTSKGTQTHYLLSEEHVLTTRVGGLCT